MAKDQREPVRIFIVDDHPIVRDGYAQMVDREPDFVVCGTASSHQEALDLLDSAKPHLAIVDITLSDNTGVELVEEIKSRNGSIRVLVISAHDEMLYAERALEAGALGYINKQQATEKLVEGIRQVMTDEVFVSETITKRMLKRRVGNSKDETSNRVDSLTNRELQVFELIGNGETTQQIANKLFVSPKTVERHKENIKIKLDLANATELVQHATRWVLEKG